MGLFMLNASNTVLDDFGGGKSETSSRRSLSATHGHSHIHTVPGAGHRHADADCSAISAIRTATQAHRSRRGFRPTAGSLRLQSERGGCIVFQSWLAVCGLNLRCRQGGKSAFTRRRRPLTITAHFQQLVTPPPPPTKISIQSCCSASQVVALLETLTSKTRISLPITAQTGN